MPGWISTRISDRLRAILEHKWLVFVLAASPAAWLAFEAGTGRLGANPIRETELTTGGWTLRLLFATLAVGPIVDLGWNWPRRARRMLGLFAFFYGCCHFLAYVWLDQGLVLADIWKDVSKHRWVMVGMAGLLCMAPLAATSSQRAIRALGPDRWRLLHRLVYVAGLAGVLHFYWLVKKDHTEPLEYAAVLALLFAFRIRRFFRRRAQAQAKRISSGRWDQPSSPADPASSDATSSPP
jgi:sulfoxide reductase heme-binding subunit YedZ